MSRFRVEVVPVALRPHPNADTLSVVEVFGYTCCVRTADFAGVDRAAYIPPDSLVRTDRPGFGHLQPRAGYGARARVKVVRLRGIVSQGLLVPAAPHWTVGQDVATELGVEHYEPPLPLESEGDAEPPPPGNRPRYDVEHWRRYRHLLRPGEEVLVTEKIHGANARYCFADGRMRCATRSEWKRADSLGNAWARALTAHPEVRSFCEAHADVTVYGEIYGRVQALHYGLAAGAIRIAVFDLLRGNQWVSADEARRLGPALPWVPTVYRGPYAEETVAALAEGPSAMPGAGHVREGVVVRPLLERTDPDIGRVQLKIVGNGYLASA